MDQNFLGLRQSQEQNSSVDPHPFKLRNLAHFYLSLS